MKKILMVLFVLLISNSIVHAEGMKGSGHEMKGSTNEMKGSSGEEMDAMMAEWKKYMMPGENHQILNALVGNWNYTMKHWMSADASVEEMVGTSKSAWIMDGRFVEEHVSGTSMGMPFNGVSMMGYNNGTGLYSSLWYDNMSTGVMFGEGTYDAKTKTITHSGSFYCPMRGGMTPYRSALMIIDENTHSYEMHMTEKDGTEFLAMQLQYTRSL